MKIAIANGQSPSPADRPSWVRRIIRGLKSIRFAIILMALIAAACLVGTLIEQGPYEADKAIAQHGRTLGLLIGRLGLNQLYSTWWFLGLLMLLALSVAVCTFSGARFSLRKLCTLVAHASILLIVVGAILRGIAGVEGTATIEKGRATDVLHVSTRVLVDYRYVSSGVEQRVQKEPQILFGAKMAILKNANVVADSIVVSDLSGATTYQAEADYIALTGRMKDQERTAIQGLQSGVIGGQPLGFDLRLDDFLIRHYEGTGESLEVRFGEATQALEIPVEVGKVVPLNAAGAKLEVLRRVLDFKMDEHGQINSEPDQEPDNPAVQVRLISPAGESKRWVFAMHPEFEGHAPDAAGIHLKYIFRPAAVKSYESQVTVLDEHGNEIRKAVVLVNSPLKVGRYTFYQSDYDHETLAASIFMVTYDPGVPFVFAGFILLPLGVALTFYVKPLLNRKGRADA